MEVTPRENMMAILEGRQPEYYADFQYAAEVLVDPIWAADMVPPDGQYHKDSWGTTCQWLPGAPGKHPHITPENAVVKDITKWKEYVQIPPVKGLDWSKAKAVADATDRSVKFVEYFNAQGLFERSHFLMGMEDAFCAYLEEPEAMIEMLTAIKDFKCASIKEAAYQLHPDVIFFQDDWGSKQNLFLPPDVWRECIKPLQKEIADTIHDCGMLYLHHADCICEPIVEDMKEIGIDVWQGVIPQNDIVAIQKRMNYHFPMIGGVDTPAIDGDASTEEEIIAEAHRAVDTYCPGGYFFPGMPAPALFERVRNIVDAELVSYGREWAAAHPIA